MNEDRLVAGALVTAGALGALGLAGWLLRRARRTDLGVFYVPNREVRDGYNRVDNVPRFGKRSGATIVALPYESRDLGIVVIAAIQGADPKISQRSTLEFLHVDTREVGVDPDDVVGFVKIGGSFSGYYGTSLDVDTNYQRRGIASDMYDYAEEILGPAVGGQMHPEGAIDRPSNWMSPDSIGFWKARLASRGTPGASK